MKNEYVKYAAMTNVALEAILSGELMRGKDLLTRVVAVQPNAVAFTRRSWCNFLLGDGEAALNDQLAARHNLRKDSTSTGVGVAYWYLKQYEQACNDWNHELLRLQSGDAVYADAAGGVVFGSLLWWASTHHGLGHWREIAEEHLRRLRSEEHYQKLGRSSEEWPGPIADYLLGRIPEDKVREMAKSNYDKVFRNHISQLLFYVAAKYLSIDNESDYKLNLNQVISFQVGISTETILARIEMNNMDMSGPLKSFLDIKAGAPNPEVFQFEEI